MEKNIKTIQKTLKKAQSTFEQSSKLFYEKCKVAKFITDSDDVQICCPSCGHLDKLSSRCSLHNKHLLYYDGFFALCDKNPYDIGKLLSYQPTNVYTKKNK